LMLTALDAKGWSTMATEEQFGNKRLPVFIFFWRP
jgi:hypothetical protein